MKISRAAEGRKSPRRQAILFSLIAIVVVAGMSVTYFTQGFGALSAKAEQPKSPDLVIKSPPAPSAKLSVLAAGPSEVPAPSPTAKPAPRPTSTPRPTPTPAPTAAAVPAAVSEKPPAAVSVSEPVAEPAAEPSLDFLPEVKFGEVLGEGLIKLKLPGGSLIDSWYTFQVDTKTRDITVFYALMNPEKQSVLSTVRIDKYTRGDDLKFAEVTLYYQDGSERVLDFNRAEGSLTVTQHHNLRYEPSMFSPNLRRSLVWYGVKLTDESSDATMELDLDVSGLSASEEMVFKKSAPSAVQTALSEIKVLVDQIEDARLK